MEWGVLPFNFKYLKVKRRPSFHSTPPRQAVKKNPCRTLWGEGRSQTRLSGRVLPHLRKRVGDLGRAPTNPPYNTNSPNPSPELAHGTAVVFQKLSGRSCRVPGGRSYLLTKYQPKRTHLDPIHLIFDDFSAFFRGSRPGWGTTFVSLGCCPGGERETEPN